MRLIAICCAALLGLGLGDLVSLQWKALAGAATLAAAATLIAWRRPHARSAAMLMCALALGALRATYVAAEHAEAEARLAPGYGRTTALHVTVIEPPALISTGTSARFVVRTEPDHPALRVIGDRSLLHLEPGDSLRLKGKLIAPDGHGPPTLLFATPQSEPQRSPSPETVPARIRQAAERAIHAHMPKPEAALAAGILLGSSSGLPEDLRGQLQRSGLAHIIAIDGYKQLLLATVVGAVARRAVGAYWARLPVLVAIVAYTLLTGAHPSALRSGLMVGLASVAGLSSRAADSLTSLLVAATLMLAIDPRLLFDLGMQLSVSATLGIILLWPRLRRRLQGVPHAIAEPAGLTLAVTLATLPIQLAVFQSVSLASPVAHIVAVPLLPIVFTAAAVVALLSPLGAIASAAGVLATLPTRVLVYVTAFFGDLPAAAVTTGRLPTSAAIALAAALLVVGVLSLPELRRARSLRSAPTISAATRGSPD